jgi:hypothetical protein
MRVSFLVILIYKQLAQSYISVIYNNFLLVKSLLVAFTAYSYKDAPINFVTYVCLAVRM